MGDISPIDPITIDPSTSNVTPLETNKKTLEKKSMSNRKYIYSSHSWWIFSATHDRDFGGVGRGRGISQIHPPPKTHLMDGNTTCSLVK